MTIRLLPKQLVNQIAAGEVVERPANVVKELVENSIDAHASKIRIEIEGGGRKLLAVHDDGEGIEAGELALAVASHATSKIAEVEDLFRVTTLGFRGEALASIASVANVSISSRTRNQPIGASIAVRGGSAEPVRPEGRPAGTSVEVRDLFFNTPARRKFLKTDATETAHIVETVLRLALARTDLEFELSSGGRRSLRLEGGQPLRERIAAGYGRELADSLLPLEAGIEGMRLSGFLAPPDQARARAQLQHLYVNGRYVRDRAVQGAVRRGFSDYLAGSLSPVYFLFLTLDPAEVDCNVHPTKIEVRLRRTSDVFRIVLAAVDRVLREADLAPRVHASTPAAPPIAGSGFPDRGEFSRFAEMSAGAGSGAGAGTLAGRGASTGSGAGGAARPTMLFERASSTAPRPAPNPLSLSPGRYLQVLSTYIVTACSEGLLILDQHALHERVLYRHLREQWQKRRVQRQELLAPICIEVSARDSIILEQAKDLLESIGLVVRSFGKTEVAVSSVPLEIGTRDLPGLLQRVVSFLAEERPEGRLDDFADRMLFTMACHRAVRAGDSLNEAQITALLEEAENIEHAHTCPHGRPTRVVIPKDELENLFKRRGF